MIRAGRKYYRLAKFNWLLLCRVFLFGLLLVSALCCSHWIMSGKRLRNFIEWGDSASTQGRHQTAAIQYANALKVDSENADALLKLGDELALLSGQDPDRLADAAKCWTSASTSRPGDVSILGRLLTYHLKLVQRQPLLEEFQQIEALSSTVARIDPNDIRARDYSHIACVQPWLFGLDSEPVGLDSKIDALVTLAQTEPKDRDLVHWAVQASIRRSQQMAQAQRLLESRRLFINAGDLCQQALDSAPVDAGFCVDLSKSFSLLAQISASDVNADSSKTIGYQHGAREAMERARSLAVADSPLHLNIQLSAAELAAHQGDVAEAESIYRHLRAEYPTNTRVSLAYSQLLSSDPSRLRDALNLLITPAMPETGESTELRSLVLLQIASIRIAMCEINPAGDGLRQRVTDAREACDQMAHELGMSPQALVLLARLAATQGRQIEAIKLLGQARELLRSSGSTIDHQIPFLEARAYVAVHEPDIAVGLLNDLLEADPGFLPARNLLDFARKSGTETPKSPQLGANQVSNMSSAEMENLFRAALDNRDWHSAEGIAGELTLLNRDQVNGATFQIRLAIALKNFGQAAILARNLTRQLPNVADAWVLLGQSLQAQGSLSEAASCYDHALALRPDDLEGLKGRVECCELTNRPGEAWNQIIRTLQKYPENLAFAELRLMHAQAYQEPDTIISEYETLARQGTERPMAILNLARVYLWASEIQAATDPELSKTNLHRARHLLDNAMLRWPEDTDCRKYAVIAAVRAQDELAGERILRDQKSSNALEASLELASYFLAFRKYDEAISVLHPFMREPSAMRLAVHIDIEASRFSDAESLLRHALTANPSESEPVCLLGELLLGTHREEEAILQFDLALKLDHSSTAAFYGRGLARLRLNQPAAINDFTSAREFEPFNPDIRLALAQALKNQNQLKSAVDELQHALQLMPLDKRIRTQLIELHSLESPPGWDEIAALTSEAESIPSLRLDPAWRQALGKMEMARQLEKMQPTANPK